MYPLRFTKVLKEKVWGGRDLQRLLGVPLEPGKTFGESWEVSVHPHGPSVVANGAWKGRSLPELVKERGAQLLGRAVWKQTGGEFPLLIKYLDVHDKLSIQVHPDDEYALAHEGEHGKSECWYVLDASPDATLILGVAPGVTRDEFRRRSSAGQWDGLFRTVRVRRGDFVAIRPGTVHASVEGSVVICEIQQNSDTTYRLYDFDRLVDGVKRPLHIERALEVIDFEHVPPVTHAETRPSTPLPEGRREALVADPLYRVDLVTLTGRWSPAPVDQFQVLSVVGGHGSVAWSSWSETVEAGQTWMLPAGVSAQWQGPLELVLSTVDASPPDSL